MSSTPYLRNAIPSSRPTSTSSNPNLSILEQRSRFLAERAANRHQVPANALPGRTLLPRHLYVQPADLEKYLADDPLVGTRGAAIILGVSIDLMKKWRQRSQGPEYYQFEDGGPILYSINALNRYKAAHLVIPRRKGRK